MIIKDISLRVSTGDLYKGLRGHLTHPRVYLICNDQECRSRIELCGGDVSFSQLVTKNIALKNDHRFILLERGVGLRTFTISFL